MIVLHANARKADLVVLGSNRRRGWQRFREGSVGERVLRRAAWAVLIVPWDAPSGRRDRNTGGIVHTIACARVAQSLTLNAFEQSSDH